jgi:hypothetical protein
MTHEYRAAKHNQQVAVRPLLALRLPYIIVIPMSARSSRNLKSRTGNGEREATLKFAYANVLPFDGSFIVTFVPSGISVGDFTFILSAASTGSIHKEVRLL